MFDHEIRNRISPFYKRICVFRGLAYVAMDERIPHFPSQRLIKRVLESSSGKNKSKKSNFGFKEFPSDERTVAVNDTSKDRRNKAELDKKNYQHCFYLFYRNHLSSLLQG